MSLNKIEVSLLLTTPTCIYRGNPSTAHSHRSNPNYHLPPTCSHTSACNWLPNSGHCCGPPGGCSGGGGHCRSDLHVQEEKVGSDQQPHTHAGVATNSVNEVHRVYHTRICTLCPPFLILLSLVREAVCGFTSMA